jgi:hypothetical protein
VGDSFTSKYFNVFELIFAFLLKVHNTEIITGRWCASTHWRELEKKPYEANGSCISARVLTCTVCVFMSGAKNVQMQKKKGIVKC